METPDELPRWAPDELLVPAILAGSTTPMSELSLADRTWVVLELKDRGHAAEAIADRLGYQVRRVRGIAADDLGQVMRLYRETAENFARELGMNAAEVKRLARALAEAERDRDRYHDQLRRALDRIDALRSPTGVPVFSCGCPKTPYNTYRAPKTGKTGCREHRRLAQQRYRERMKTTAEG